MNMHPVISRVSILLLGAGLSGCAVLGGLTGGGGDGDSAKVATGAAAASEYKPPKADVVVEVVKADQLRENVTIIVPSAYVKFPVGGKVSVAEQGSALSTIGGGNANSVKASATFTVKGLDKALAQKIAKAAYDDFVAQLRGAGYTVLTYDDVKDRGEIKDADRESPDRDYGLPTEKIWGGATTAVVAAPSDAQMFDSGMTGLYSEFISMGKLKFKDAALIIPVYTLTAPQMWGEKSQSYSTIGAAVHGAPAMVLAGADANWMVPNPGWGMANGIPGAHLKGLTHLSLKVGELVKVEDTTSGAANAISATLSILTGSGRITSNSAKFDMVIDAAAYEKAALDGLRRFNAEVAKGTKRS